MTTLQARSWARFGQRAAKARDYSRFWEIAHTVLGIVLLVALFGAGIALRVLMFVHLP